MKKKTLLLLGGASVVIVAIVAIVLITMVISQNNISELIKENNFAELNKIYLERIKDDSEKKADMKDELVAVFNVYITEYNNSEKTFENINKLFIDASDYDFYDDMDMEKLYKEFLALKESKDAFGLAEEYINEGLYIKAIEQYNKIIKEDKNYTRKELLIEGVVNEIIVEAEIFIKNGDYPSAINLMRDCCLNDLGEIFSEKYEEYVTEYVNMKIAEAERVFTETEDYLKAIETLKSVYLGIDDTSDALYEPIYNEINKYSAYQPVSLSSLDYTQKADYIVFDNSYNKDVNEFIFTTDVLCPTGYSSNSAKAKSEDEAYITYYLNGKYKKLSGVLFRPYKSLSCTYEWENKTIFKVYGDGVLLYEGPAITQNTYDNIEFNIDVTGVRELKIVMMGIWEEPGNHIGLVNRYPMFCATELEISY